MGLLLFWLLFSLVPAFIATRRGRSGPAWLLLAILISPVVALGLVLFGTDLTKAACPECREFIKVDARRCPHCRVDLSEYHVVDAGSTQIG